MTIDLDLFRIGRALQKAATAPLPEVRLIQAAAALETIKVFTGDALIRAIATGADPELIRLIREAHDCARLTVLDFDFAQKGKTGR